MSAAPQAEAPAGVRMIVVRTEAEATSVLSRIKAGEKFEDLAKSVSTDSSARSGGYIGAFSPAQLRPEFKAALQGVSPGQVSPVVRIGREYALLQLLGASDTQAIELQAWIDSGSNPKSPIVERLWTMAVTSNDGSLIKRLLDAHADVNAAFGDGSTVLMGAAQAGQIASVRALLAAGASVNSQTADGTTALLVAAQSGQAEIVRVLLDAGAAPNAKKNNGVTPLVDASFGGHLETVRVLLKAGADPNLALQDGSTALMAASGKGQNEIIRALLASGAQVNAGINSGGTALMEAAYGGHAEAVRILLAAGADVKAADPNGLTALMGAALGGHTDAVRALLDARAPVTPKDSRGWTALTYGRASANAATVRLLLSAATDITPQERSIALGGTYLNEYYSSNDAALLASAESEFQKVLTSQPQNREALEWMGAVEFLRWDKAPTLDQFKKANSFLKRSADLDPKDPDRHYWLAATSSIFVSAGKGASDAEIASILDDGIAHAKRAIELDPEFADAMDHLSVLYRRKGLEDMAAAVHQDAVRIRQRRGNRPSRFNDQFSRPAVPPAPNL
jgi:ankyrin repeat protein